MINQENFHTAIGPTIKVAQYFGILPISGVLNKSPSMMEFKIKSFRTFWTVFIIISLVIILITFIVTIIKTIMIGNTNIIGLISANVFFGNAIMSLILFLRFSPKWIKLLKKWEDMENILNSFDVNNQNIRSKINNISIIFTIIAVLEHCLYGINHTANTGFPGYISGLYNFFISTYNIDAEKFSFTNFNSTFIISIFLWIIDNFATVIWNFTDLFIILISTGLADRYAWLNKSIKYSSRRKFQVLYWYQIRRNYAILSDLVKRTNDDLSALIFLSYYTNLYFICLQLFQGITIQRNGGLNKIYFFVSFCYLISRTIAVTISASRINVESKVVLPNIYSCPSSAFTNETKRLQHQIATDDVVLTGMNFFSITRNFMLVTAGVIVTYEVVLLQLIVTTNK